MASNPSAPPPGGGGSNRARRGGALAALVGVAIAGTLNLALDRGEGNRKAAYADSIGIQTACRGVIRNADGSPIRRGQRFTPAECNSLNEVETVRHLQAAFAAVPSLQEGCPENCRRPNQIVAAGSLVYNIGPRAFRNSTVARRWNAGDWWGGCEAFGRFNRAGGRVIRGLALRRAWEQRDYCFIGLTPPAGRRP
ncbi:MAG: lysozyme [Sphingomonadales bacterium]|jgi:lysozyme|nr:lysozyme [Sphingomonadales bacterium]